MNKYKIVDDHIINRESGKILYRNINANYTGNLFTRIEEFDYFINHVNINKSDGKIYVYNLTHIMSPFIIPTYNKVIIKIVSISDNRDRVLVGESKINLYFIALYDDLVDNYLKYGIFSRWYFVREIKPKSEYYNCEYLLYDFDKTFIYEKVKGNLHYLKLNYYEKGINSYKIIDKYYKHYEDIVLE